MVTSPGLTAPVTYVEATDGQFSSEVSSPTELGILAVGTNSVTAGLNDGTGQHEVFNFEIGTDNQLVGIVLTKFEDGNGDPIPDDRMFFAFHNEETFPVRPEDLNGAIGNEFLGGALIGRPTDLNVNLIQRLGNREFGIGSGYTAPLPESYYTFFVQQTGGQNTQYTVEFQVAAVSAIPEPSTYAILGIGGLAFAVRQRRKAKRAHA